GQHLARATACRCAGSGSAGPAPARPRVVGGDRVLPARARPGIERDTAGAVLRASQLRARPAAVLAVVALAVLAAFPARDQAPGRDRAGLPAGVHHLATCLGMG